MRLALIMMLCVLVAYAGDQAVVIDGQNINGITKVVRTGDTHVGIRYSGGLLQAEIGKLPDSFLRSWGITGERAKPEGTSGEPFKMAQSFTLITKMWHSSSYGGVLEYSLDILVHPRPHECVLQFSAKSTETIGPKDSPAMIATLMIPESGTGAILQAIAKFQTYWNTKTIEPQLLGNIGKQRFYYSPQGVMTGSLSSGPSDKYGGVMIRFENKVLADPPYLTSDELDVLEEFLQRFQKGEFESLIDRNATPVAVDGGSEKETSPSQSNDRQAAPLQPAWARSTAIELEKLTRTYDLVIVPADQQPGFYFRGIWIPLGELITTVRKVIPELAYNHGSSSGPPSLAIPKVSMYLISGGGTHLRKLFMFGGGLAGTVAPRTVIFGGLEFGDSAAQVIEVLGKPSVDKLPYRVIYRRADYTLDIGFNYGKLHYITFNSRGYDALN